MCTIEKNDWKVLIEEAERLLQETTDADKAERLRQLINMFKRFDENNEPFIGEFEL